MGNHEELLGVTESVFKNLASVSQTGRRLDGPFVDGTCASQNLGYFEILILVRFLAVCFPEDSKDF